MIESSRFIAVVDDEEPVRRGLERLLRSFAFDVRCFESGDAFLDSLPDALPDCVILDLHMPRMDGIAVLERMEIADVHVPVIVMTGRDFPGARERAMRLGVLRYLQKPIDGTVLHDAIAEARKL